MRRSRRAAPAPGTLLQRRAAAPRDPRRGAGLADPLHDARDRWATRRGDGPGGRPRGARPATPVIAWAHGTTGVATRCAPSLQADPLGAGAMPDVAQVLRRGLGGRRHGLRRARRVAAAPVPRRPAGGPVGARRGPRRAPAARADLAPKTVVWGHSQGGGAALWTGSLAPAYAPDVHVLGVAALAPATTFRPCSAAAATGRKARSSGRTCWRGYGAAYPDVRLDRYVVPRARPLVRRIAGRCLGGTDGAAAVADAIAAGRAFSQSPAAGPLGRRLAQNVPDEPVRAAVLIGQG